MKTVMVQRTIEKFRRALLTQRLNFSSQKLFVRFLGEAAIDAVGLFWEFLTLGMTHFFGVRNSFFDGPCQPCFTNNTESIHNNTLQTWSAMSRCNNEYWLKSRNFISCRN